MGAREGLGRVAKTGWAGREVGTGVAAGKAVAASSFRRRMGAGCREMVGCGLARRVAGGTVAGRAPAGRVAVGRAVGRVPVDRVPVDRVAAGRLLVGMAPVGKELAGRELLGTERKTY